MVGYDVFRGEKSCLVCGGSHCVEEWKCERGVQ